MLSFSSTHTHIHKQLCISNDIYHKKRELQKKITVMTPGKWGRKRKENREYLYNVPSWKVIREQKRNDMKLSVRAWRWPRLIRWIIHAVALPLNKHYPNFVSHLFAGNTKRTNKRFPCNGPTVERPKERQRVHFMSKHIKHLQLHLLHSNFTIAIATKSLSLVLECRREI